MKFSRKLALFLIVSLSLLVAACGGGSGTPAVDTSAAVAASLKSAAALPVNDAGNMDNPSAPFTVVQTAGLNPVSLNSPLKVNFAVFSKASLLRASSSTPTFEWS